MLLELHPKNPNPRVIKQVVECLQEGGVIVYPTDTIYGLGCDIFHPKAMERIATIKNIDLKKAHLSFVCADLSQLSRHTKSISTPLYRQLKAHLPGAFTFVLPASKEVPKLLQSKKNTVGIRVPDNNITKQLLEGLGNPIVSTSLPGEMIEEYTDPLCIYEKFGKQVDLVIDGGIGGMIPSTVVDCVAMPPVVLRQGVGIWDI